MRSSLVALVVFAASCGGKTEEPGNTNGGGGTGSGGSANAGSGGGGSAEPPGLSDCDVPSDCTLMPATCCGTCGSPTTEDMRAVNRSVAASWTRDECREVGCPDCAGFPNPSLLATCEGGTCRAVDLQTHGATACTGDGECRVRVAVCCECGGDTSPGSLVAISGEAALSALVCDPDMGCDGCLPSYPPEVTARCENGHCVAGDGRLPF